MDLISDEVKGKLGIGESAGIGMGKLRAKAFDYNGDGVLVVGFE